MSCRQAVALGCLFMGLGLLGVLASMAPLFSNAEENLGLNMLYLLRGAEKSPDDVVLVAIDSESADALALPLNLRQWPRRLHARMLDRLTGRQAAVIAFDLLFQDPQETVDDQAMATAIRNAGNVVLTQAIDRQTMSLTDPDNAGNTRVTVERVISAIPAFADEAAGQAPFPLPKVPFKLNQFWCFRSASGNMPTMPVVAFHIYAKDAFPDFLNLLFDVDERLTDIIAIPEEGEPDVRMMIGIIRPLRMCFEEDATLQPRALEKLETYPPGKISQRTTALIRSLLSLYGSGNSRYLNFYGPPGAVRTISYHRLVNTPESATPAENMPLQKGAAVFVGQTVSKWIKTHDDFFTVFSGASGQSLSGVEIAATAFSNLLEDKGVYPLGGTPRLMLLLGWGILLGFVSVYFSTAFSATGLVLLNGMYFGLAFAQFKSVGIWYPLVVPVLLQSPVAFVLGLVYKYRKADIERRNIRKAFGYYLPKEVVDRLSANLKTLNLDSEEFYGVCMFTDAQNYTTLSERLDPSSLINLMNAYYKAVFEPVQSNGGLVLQVVGDSVMALWTASEEKNEIKHAACMAAVEITAAVEKFNQEAGELAMPTRIGIHAGEMVLGNIGAADHFEYRPVGDIVNTASRLEGLNRFLGTHMLVSQDAISESDDFMKRSVGRFVFKGKSQPVHVVELLARDPYTADKKAPVHGMFASGLEAFQKGLREEADDRFHRALEIDPNDGPSLFYISECRKPEHSPGEKNRGGAIHLEYK